LVCGRAASTITLQFVAIRQTAHDDNVGCAYYQIGGNKKSKSDYCAIVIVNNLDLWPHYFAVLSSVLCFTNRARAWNKCDIKYTNEPNARTTTRIADFGRGLGEYAAERSGIYSFAA
jgi:hypothetical protein